MNAIGAPLTRVDGPAKVTGSARYAAEFHPDGLAYAATCDSTVPAGRIIAIHTAAAEIAPGVLLVLTHLNADRLPYEAPAERPAVDPVTGEQLRVLQDAEIRFSGQPVALGGGEHAGTGVVCCDLGPRDLRAPIPPVMSASTRHSPSRPPRRPPRRAAAPRPGRATRTPPSPRHRSGSTRPTVRRASSTTPWNRTPPSRTGRASGSRYGARRNGSATSGTRSPAASALRWRTCGSSTRSSAAPSARRSAPGRTSPSPPWPPAAWAARCGWS